MSGADQPAVDVSPFDLGRGLRDAALCLHGLTGTPYEVRPLGEALARAGIRAWGPALPGHNETPEALSKVPYTAWLGAAREALARLREEHVRVFAVGLSMGGLLSLALASEGRVDAVVVIGTPLRLRAPLPWLVPVLKRLMPFPTKRVGSDIRDVAARERHPSYPVMPLESVHQLMHLQKVVRRGLRGISAPVLVAHGDHDQTADPRDAERIRAGVGDEKAELLRLERSAHVVPVDFDGPRLGGAISEFLLRRGGARV